MSVYIPRFLYPPLKRLVWRWIVSASVPHGRPANYGWLRVGFGREADE